MFLIVFLTRQWICEVFSRSDAHTKHGRKSCSGKWSHFVLFLSRAIRTHRMCKAKVDRLKKLLRDEKNIKFLLTVAKVYSKILNFSHNMKLNVISSYRKFDTLSRCWNVPEDDRKLERQHVYLTLIEIGREGKSVYRKWKRQPLRDGSKTSSSIGE